MSAWLKRFGLHMAAAIGATGIFVAAAAVGANQTRQQVAVLGPVEVSSPTPGARRKPTLEVVATPVPAAAAAVSGAAPTQPGPTQVPAGPTQVPAGPTQVPAGPTQVPARPTEVQPAVADRQPGEADAPPAQAVAVPPPGAVQAPPGARPPTNVVAPAQAPTAPNQAAAKPNPARPTPTPTAASGPVPATQNVVPERSLAGTVKAVLPDGLDVVGVGGREWRVSPAPGALIRLNGKPARLDALRAGDTVVILGQAQTKDGPLFRFLAHAITARRK